MNGSVSQRKTMKSAFLVILMIIMTQVGYLDLINNQPTSNDSLSEEIPVSETAQGTSIVYGNNTQWAPSGSLETYGFSGSADIIATSDDVILLKGKVGKDSRTYCIIAYNYVNKTSWQPNVVGTSQCPGTNSYWKFIGIIDGVTLVRYDLGNSNNQNHAIFGYNPSNDTFYSIASLPSAGASVGSAAVIGRNVYMGTSHSDVTIFNYDNQTIWEPTNLNCGYSFHSSYFGALGDKIFSKCGNWLGIFDPVTQSLSIPSDLSSVYVNSTISPTRSVVLGDQLLFLGDDSVNGKELWVYDASNGSGWMAADIAVGSDSAWSLFGNLNPMRSGTKVLFEATDHFGDKDLWWYDSINASVWRATNFSDPNINFYGHSTNSYGELANGVIAVGHKTLDTPSSSYYSYYISFYNPNNGTVWQESGLYQSMEQNAYAQNNNGQIKLRAVYGNTIIGTAHANTGSPVGHYVKVFAYDITNQTLQFSENLGGAQYSHYDIVHTNMVTFGDHILYGLACGNNIANSCPTVGGGRQAAVAWSPGAIAVNDAWNISAGDRLDGPISGGDGRFYNSGAGVQNLTASSEGAEVMVGEVMDEITFQYNASAASGMTNVIGAICGISPPLPNGLNIDSNNCTISGTPTVESANQTYTVTAIINSTTFQTTVWLSIIPFGTVTSVVDGAVLQLGETMTPITLDYTSQHTGSGSPFVNTTGPVGSAENAGIKIAVDSNGHKHIIHGRAGVGTVYATDVSGSWMNFTLLPHTAGRVVDIAVDSNDNVHIIASDSNGNLGYMTNAGGSWSAITTIDSTVPTGWEANMAIDLFDNIHVSYYDGSDFNGNLKYATNTGGSWTTKFVDNTPSRSGRYNSITTDSNGYAHISYSRDNPPASRDIYYATNLHSSLSPADTSFTTRALNVGGFNDNSIALDSNDVISIVFHTSGGGIDLASCSWVYTYYPCSSSSSTVTWINTPLSNLTGTGVSAGFDSNDNLHMNYIHNSMLYHSTNESGSWVDAVIDTPQVGSLSYNDLAVDSGDNVHSSYIHYETITVQNSPVTIWTALYMGIQASSSGSGGGSGSGASGVSWSTHPALPAGVSISNGEISGTPSVYASNQTYTIYANQSGHTTTHDLYISVDNAYPHTVVEDQPIGAIGFHPAFWDGTTTWTIAPSLPNSLSQDSATGEITGTVDSPMSDTFTVTATHSSGATETFTFSLESLLDTDGDGLANDLPPTYNPTNPPTSGLIADDDDDGDGLFDSVETDTGLYVDGQDTGTDPLNPDTDDDGICDGPNAVPQICIAGPDPSPNGNTPPPTLVGVNNTDIGTVSPYLVVPGGMFEISPDLPNSLSIDPITGEITGTPTQTLTNTTFTVWCNHTDGTSVSWDFTIEILEDSDGDGMPNELPDDYDPTNPDSPGLIEDLDDDNDGNSDVDEADEGTNPTNPDTDGDGMCDGPVASPPNCVAGPDAFPLDPSADTDTDGDGDPDTLVPGVDSNSIPPLVEDLDDDGDGLDDVNETNTGVYNGLNNTGTDPLDPDTDNDGICDGPNDVLPICVAGPDEDFGVAVDGAVYLVNNTQMVMLNPKYTIENGVYEIAPDLPAGVTINPQTGVISGTPTEVMAETTFTVYGNNSQGGVFFTFELQVLEDSDGDEMPNELPDDYPTNDDNYNLIEDIDDDNDGASDEAETGTGIFVDGSDMGTDSLNPDTDGDGICDGPNSVLPICIAGPDSNPLGNGPLGPTVLVNNTEMVPLPPANAVPGAIWAVSLDLPIGLTLNVTTGVISGTPLETMDNTTFTLWANTSEPRSIESTFWLEVLEDTDRDGLPDQLPDDYPDSGLPPYDLVEDLDDDADGMPDVDEANNGTDSLNPDSDGDGFCDGPSAVDGVCYAGPDSHPLDPDMPVNTDGDAFPDDDPDGEGGLIADDDDDNDGYLDTEEIDCLSDPLDVNDVPSDMDGDGICDALDDDMDGDGLLNDEETNTGDFAHEVDSFTDPANPDTDGDGVCDGPATPDVTICAAGPDAFPEDPAASLDTDNDGMPDDLFGESTTGLTEDQDDDNDLIDDEIEILCGTDPKIVNTLPDVDGDGICDAMDDIIDLPFEFNYDSQHLDLFANRTMEPFLPTVTGLGDVATWELVGELPEGLTFGMSEARTNLSNGAITGTPLNATDEPVILVVWANNSNYQQMYGLMLTVFNDTDNDSLPDFLPENYTGNITVDDDDDGDGWLDQDEINCGSDPNDPESNPTNTDGEICIKLADGGEDNLEDGLSWWCFPLCFLLLLLLLVPLLLLRDKVIAVIDDAEPENAIAKPKFAEGAGTKDNPFVLKPFKTVKAGDTIVSKEVITITGITPGLKVKSVDYFDRENGRKFTMQDQSGSDEGVRMIEADEEGEMVFKLVFDDSHDPTIAGGEFQGAVKVGRRSVYLLWDVKVKPDPEYVKEQKKLEADRKKAEKEAEKQAKKAAAEAEKQAKKEAKAETDKAKKAAGAEAEEKAKKQAGKEAKAAEKQSKAEADKAKKAADAKAKKEAEAKAKKEAKAAEKETKKAASKKPAASKEAKKQEEIKRVKSRAKSIDFKVLGVASSTKLRSEVKKGAKKLGVADAKEFADAGSAAITDDKGSITITWTGKDGNTLTGVGGITRVFGKASVVMVRDDLQDIKGIGPFIEEKLNALGITTYRQIANMTAKLETQVNEAIEFFPGRVKRDQWVAQAKILLGEDAKLDEKALKQAEELERVAQKAETIDFDTLGVATIEEKDDLQTIKGIGPFIADKLYALGIYTFAQVGNMTPKIEEEVNKAIEFFPGRVKRDEWAKQAKELAKNKK
ncbi:MAG TPA: hypothetical protein D7I07_04230 [Candidatus Poseidoniales archaeon]|nr:MAG TPA: hypothetical protein D7I07_04230 [Candidatus Poseidoniales archaeon]